MNKIFIKALKYIYATAVKIMIAMGADVNAKDKDGRTVLMLVSFGGHKKMVEALIANGANVNAKDNGGRTALKWAIFEGHTEVAESLLAAGADVNTKDNGGGTVLIWSSYRGHKELVQSLIAAGADVNAKDKIGWTPLIAASVGGNKEAVELLIQNGANVNAKDKDEWTALMWALYRGYIEVGKELITKGAIYPQGYLSVSDLLFNLKDTEGRHSLINVVRGDEEVVTINIMSEELQKLVSRYDILESVFYKKRRERNEVAAQLLQHNENNYRFTGYIFNYDKKCKTALHYAAEQGFKKTVVLLLDTMEKQANNGSNINIQESNNHTALSLAANYGHHETVKLLLDNGADPYIPNKNGDTALFWAMARGHKDTVKELKSL